MQVFIYQQQGYLLVTDTFAVNTQRDYQSFDVFAVLK